jgi:hypothetical protein
MEEDEDFNISLDSKDECTSRPSTWDDVVDDEYMFGPSIEDDGGLDEVVVESFGGLGDKALRLEYN